MRTIIVKKNIIIKNMSGHSKWATIKRAKEAQDKKRSNVFTKLAKDIIVAARAGGDPKMNFKLRMAIEKAKQYNMPKDNIERAVKKGSGELSDGAVMEEVLYEGFGPAGVAVIVEATTDNKNRTAANVRSIFTKGGGTLGSQNSVMWMFDYNGILKIKKEQVKDSEAFILEMIDSGALDVIDEDDSFIIITSMSDFQTIKELLDLKNLKTEYAELEYISKESGSNLKDEDNYKLEKFIDTLLDDDDVNNVFTNVSK